MKADLVFLDPADLFPMSDEHAKTDTLEPASLTAAPAPAVGVVEAAPPSPEPPVALESESAGAVVEPEPAADGESVPPPPAEPEPSKKRWYIVKIQSGREDTIKNAIERRVRIEGLEEFFGQILIPSENVIEMREGKKIVKRRKLYPGYLMAEVEYNDRILYLFRETSGVGDFVGGGGIDKEGNLKVPTPMPDHEIQKILQPTQPTEKPEVNAKPPVERGDRVRVKGGSFAGFEGEVKEILEAKGQIRVELTIFGRPVHMELEYWGVDRV